MATNAVLAWDILYEIDDGTDGDTYDTIGEVFDFQIPGESAEEVDVTHYQSPERTREYIAGMRATESADFSINWIPGDATDIIIRNLRASGDTRKHRITFQGDQRVTYNAVITGFQVSLPIGDKQSATITVKRSGAETWDAVP